MELFAALERDDYEELLFCQDKASGLKAIIAIHDTTLGPALGGTRMWTYATEEDDIQKCSVRPQFRRRKNSDHWRSQEG